MRIVLLFLFFIGTLKAQDLTIAPNWQLELHLVGQNHMICKASMIAPEWAITAAHCTSPSLSYIPHSSENLFLKDSKGATYRVFPNGIYNFMSYNPFTLNGDFSLIKIYSVNKSKKTINKFPVIPKINDDEIEIFKLYTTKWIANDPYNNFHYKFPVKVKQSTSSSFINIKSPYGLCQINQNGQRSGSNSGSPLYMTDKKNQDQLIGIHSKSLYCDSKATYFFTNLAQYQHWIDGIIENSSSY